MSSIYHPVMKRFWYEPKYKIIFCPIQKVASSAFKRLFLKFQGDNDYDHTFIWSKAIVNTFHSIGPQKAQTLLQEADWTKVVVLRDPFERLVSAFLHIKGAHPFGVKINGEYFNFANYSFDQFLYSISDGKGEFRHQNFHWNPQISFFKYPETFNYFIDFKELKIQGKNLLMDIGAWEDHGKSGWGEDRKYAFLEENLAIHATQSSEKKKDYKEFKPMIQRLYREDYELINKIKFGEKLYQKKHKP